MGLPQKYIISAFYREFASDSVWFGGFKKTYMRQILFCYFIFMLFKGVFIIILRLTFLYSVICSFAFKTNSRVFILIFNYYIFYLCIFNFKVHLL